MKDSKKVIRFILYAMSLYLAWYVFYDLWMFEDGRVDTWLSLNVASASAGFLNFIGYNAATVNTHVQIDGRNVVMIGNPCNGMVLLALFSGFIIAFPGPVIKKLLYIPLGLIAIYLINVLRVVALALNVWYDYESLDFNHKYTFTFLVYACIFAMWMLWVKKISGIATPANYDQVPKHQPA